MDALRTADNSRSQAFNSSATIREESGYARNVNEQTNIICHLLSDEEKVSAKPAKDSEKQEILEAVIASVLTDLTYDMTDNLSDAESISKRAYPTPYAKPSTLKNKSLFQHFSILHDMHALSREIFLNIDIFNDTITKNNLDRFNYKNLYTFSGLNTKTIADWFNNVLSKHRNGLTFLGSKAPSKTTIHEIDTQHCTNHLLVAIQKLTDGSFIYATAGIQPSPLHSGAGYAHYPNLMSLGTTALPRMTQTDTFSIVAEAKKDHYFMIMKPQSTENHALLPAYGEIFDEREVKDPESGTVRVTINQSKSVSLAETSIHWSTTPPLTDGALIYDIIPADSDDLLSSDDATYSFQVSLTGSRKGDKYFYYWCPTTEQMSFLKSFASLRGKFTLQELLNEITLPRYGNTAVLIDEINLFIH